MKAYKFLYYKLYRHWLKRKKEENNAHINAVLSITLLFFFNIGDIMFIIIYFKHLNLPPITPFVEFLIVLFLVLLGIVNYFLLAYKKKYLAISDEFEKLPPNKSKLYSIWVLMYIVVTFAIPVIVAILFNYTIPPSTL